MSEDSHLSYGKLSSGSLVSYDEGRSWSISDKDFFDGGNYSVKLINGDVFYTITPASEDINSYVTFPAPINEKPIDGYYFYKESELPHELRGVYLKIRSKDGAFNEVHGALKDPQLLRYSINNMMPIVWWGNIKQKADGAIVAGVYPAYYHNSNGEVMRSGIAFYESSDRGQDWNKIGVILYQQNGENPELNIFDGEDGFTEPTFEILKNGTFLCVMRSGSTTPMYKSLSNDCGKNWTTPVPFTSNGVRPNLLQLDNGILVLTSGRPGAQIRFCIDGDGDVWTTPIDMLSFAGNNGEYDENSVKVSCGYTDIVRANNNSFYIVYSDFKTRNKEGELRKAIMFRKVEVVKK